MYKKASALIARFFGDQIIVGAKVFRPMSMTQFDKLSSNMDAPPHIDNETNSSVELTTCNVNDFIESYDNFLFDCDGVLWGKDHITPIPGISDTIEQLRMRGKKLMFVTNNSIHGRDAYVRKFNELAGFTADRDDVFGVAYAAAVHLKEIAKITGRVYMIGSKGMKDELDEQGIEHLGYGPDTDPVPVKIEDLFDVDIHADVEAVLVGFDEYFNYNKMYKASCYLSRENCRYIATNDVEKRVTIGPNRVQPITGSLVAAVTAATDIAPTVLGKPHAYMMDCIMAKNPGMDLSRTIMIGDSLKADIPFAKNCGIDSALVLTGVSTKNDLSVYKAKGIQPSYIMSSLSDIARLLQR